MHEKRKEKKDSTEYLSNQESTEIKVNNYAD